MGTLPRPGAVVLVYGTLQEVGLNDAVVDDASREERQGSGSVEGFVPSLKDRRGVGRQLTEALRLHRLCELSDCLRASEAVAATRRCGVYHDC